MVAEDVVGAALLVGGAQPRGRLDDVDVDVDVGGCVGRRGRRLVGVDVEVDGGDADGLAGEEPDALEGQELFRAVGEGFVLLGGVVLAVRRYD